MLYISQISATTNTEINTTMAAIAIVTVVCLFAVMLLKKEKESVE